MPGRKKSEAEIRRELAKIDRSRDAEQYRLMQAQKMLDLFEEAHGRKAKTPEELETWISSPEGKAATAYDRAPDGTIIPG